MNIKEIASLAGVSRATVSRYFNDGYVSEDKRECIREVIEKTGYVPSVSAQALRTKKSMLIGVIVPKISSESVSHMVDGISRVLTERGYHILLGNTENSTEKEWEYINLFRNNRVDGIVFIATSFTDKHFEELKALKAPVVIVGQELDEYCSVFHDDYHAAKELAAYMVKCGCRKIGYLGVTEEDKAVGVERKRGFQDAVLEAGMKNGLGEMMVCKFTYESGYEQMRNLLQCSPDIDSVFCVTDTIAVGAMDYIRERKLRIPEDISVVGMGDSQIARVVTPKLTTARYYQEEGGQQAAAMLLGQIDKKSSQVKKVKLSYEIILRDSVVSVKS